MAVYADFVYYTETYRGTAIAQSDFERLAQRASERIDRLTFSRAAAVVEANAEANTIGLIKMATCAVAEEIQKLEASGGAVQAERVGNLSVTYLNQKSEAARLADAASLYLWPTGLMFRGLLAEE